eukprot:TRINITY_DN2316_c0_g1_i1.p1 TRINITY_DN2316_c0_g1~~TRINITY_DN2316_c0_g1_i1.p1  ORF type:complete len:696 (+),score=221.36 TRINITY_DN2316_c0_g1_i1:59-2146(+)
MKSLDIDENTDNTMDKWVNILNSAVNLSKAKHNSKQKVQQRLSDMNSLNSGVLAFSMKNKLPIEQMERTNSLTNFQKQLNQKTNAQLAYRLNLVENEYKQKTEIQSQAFDDVLNLIERRKQNHRLEDIINSTKRLNQTITQEIEETRIKKDELARTEIAEKYKKIEYHRIIEPSNEARKEFLRKQQIFIEEEVLHLHDDLLSKYQDIVTENIRTCWKNKSDDDLFVFSLIDESITIEENLKYVEKHLEEGFKVYIMRILHEKWGNRLDVFDRTGRLQDSDIFRVKQLFFETCYEIEFPEILEQATIFVFNLLHLVENERNWMYMEERERQLQLDLEEEMRCTEIMYMKSHDLARSKLVGVTQVISVSKEKRMLAEQEAYQNCLKDEEVERENIERQQMFVEAKNRRQSLVDMEENRLSEMKLMRIEEERRRRVDRFRKRKLQVLHNQKEREMNKIREQIRAVESEERKRKQKEEQKAAEEKRLQLEIEYEAKKLRKQKEKQRKQLEEQKFVAEVEQKIKEMLIEGAVFLKHGHRGAPKRRHIWMSSALDLVQWRDPGSSKEKVKSHLFWSDIFEVRLGQTTEVFERQSGEPGKERSSFSLIGRERTLDLECENPAMANNWFKAFKWLLDQRQKERVSKVNEFVKMTRELNRRKSSTSVPNSKFGRSSTLKNFQLVNDDENSTLESESIFGDEEEV